MGTLTFPAGLQKVNGQFYLVNVKTPEVGVVEAHFVLDEETLTLSLVAPCGCFIGVPLAEVVRRLGAEMAGKHGEAGNGTQVH